MPRLIDADAFWEQFETAKDGIARIEAMLPSEVVDATIAIYDEIKERLDVAPTIEPPTTEWLGNHTPFRCKRCGHYSDTRTPFCAYCGKKANNYEQNDYEKKL